MNVSILEDNDYTEGVEKMILETIGGYSDFTDKASLWEFLKIRIKNYTFQFCVAKARNMNVRARAPSYTCHAQQRTVKEQCQRWRTVLLM